jgi:chemotaxis protein methyltransferase CheR
MNDAAAREAAPREAHRFRAAIAQRLGLHFEDAKLRFLDEILQRRLRALNESSDAYLWALEHEAMEGELTALAEHLTVTETYFFRNSEQFQALTQAVLPDRMQAQAISRTLRLLSAGCASGEEPYSMAMAAQDIASAPSWELSIRAVDLNPVALKRARRGRFSAWSLRETSSDMQRRWFSLDGREAVLNEAARGAVQFEQRNLAADDPDLWTPARYDVVFCRNVLMYFSPSQAAAVVTRIARSLAPGGYLFLGHAETLRGLSEDFDLRHTHGTFYYQRKGEIGARRVAEISSWPASAASCGGDPAMARSDAWIDVIRQATERVEALIPKAAPAMPATSPSAWTLAGALDLLRQERFAQALDALAELPPEANDDPAALLLRAVLLLHCGHRTAAEAVCHGLLARGELRAGAHFVLALCEENAANVAAAAERQREAARLDPDFAMPRLRLGLLAKREGDRAVARRELGQALLLLEREDPERLILFGGGFSRKTLIALCQSALGDCGEPA